MEILPYDLNERWYRLLLELRTGLRPGRRRVNRRPGRRAPGWLRLLLGRQIDETRARLLAHVADRDLTLRLVTPLWALTLLFATLYSLVAISEISSHQAMLAAAAGSAFSLPLSLFWMGRRARELALAPVGLLEVRELRYSAEDATDQAFLDLLEALLAVNPPPGAEPALREALSAFSGAMQRLPRRLHPRTPAGHAETLRADAAQMRRVAEEEGDPITAAALGEGARAMEIRSRLQERRDLIARRSRALAGSLEIQMRTLAEAACTAELSAAGVEACESLAAAARQALSEVEQVVRARDELEAAPLKPAGEETSLRLFPRKETRL